MAKEPTEFERRFLEALDRHLQGWEDKIARDFSAANLRDEVAALRGDMVAK